MDEKSTAQTVTVDLRQLLELYGETAGKNTGFKQSTPLKPSQEIEFNLFNILFALLKRWWIILLATLVFAGAAFGFFYTHNETRYRAVAKMYVNNDSLSIGSAKVSISLSDLNAAESLVSTYVEILNSRITLNVVAQELKDDYGYDYTYGQLSGMIRCTGVSETVIFNITATESDPVRAIRIANKAAEVLPDQISLIIDGASARIVDWAVDASPISTGYTRQTVIAALLGFICACVGVILRDCVFNDVIDSSDWLTTNFDSIPLLAEIPDIVDHGSSKKGDYGYRYGYYKNDYGKAAAKKHSANTNAAKK